MSKLINISKISQIQSVTNEGMKNTVRIKIIFISMNKKKITTKELNYKKKQLNITV